MTRRRIQNILLKEWRLLFTDMNSTLLITLLPLAIVGEAILYIWLAQNFGGEAMLESSLFQEAMRKLTEALPAVAQLPPEDQVRVLLLSQANLFLLLIPTIIAVSVATFSIVDEKTSGSLEALLATPVRTWELLLGKALAGAIPALIVTWVSAAIFLAAVAGLGWGSLAGLLATASWYLSLFLLAPAVTLLSFLLGVIGSSKAKDARSAQTLVLFIVFPVMALVGIQVIGLVWFTPLLTLALALAIAAADAIVLRFAVSLFRRESILVGWR